MNTSDSVGELARGWIEAWVRLDLDWLRAHLTEDFLHVSPFGRLEGRSFYLDTVAPIAQENKHELVIREVVAGDERAVVWFDNRTPRGSIPTCDWVTVTAGRISTVHSFYDSTLVREILSATELRSLGGRQ